MSGITLARPLQLRNKPVTRVENYCATGSEALRAAAYAVASGAYDVAMAVGAEKVKDSGYQGLNANNPPNDGTARTLTAAAMFSMVAPAYGQKYGSTRDQMTDVLATISSKNHYNGARNPRAQFRKASHQGDHLRSSRRGWPGPLGVFDCAGVADGAAAAIVVRAEDALLYTDKPLYIKGLSFVAGSGSGLIDPDYDYTHFPECEAAAGRRLPAGRHHRSPPPAGHGRGARLLHPDRAGPHGGPGLRGAGHAWKEVLAGTFALDGELPINPDGGLKSFGHPVGASGCACSSSAGCSCAVRPRPNARSTTDRTLALTHNLGGYPGEMVSFVSVVGTELG
jgi:acetyl-CoA C-acetyltransferase